MTKLNVTGLKEKSKSLGPGPDGTYAHIGARGGTEMMMEGLRKHVPKELLDGFNVICSRVTGQVDVSNKPILWLHDTWDDPESEHLKNEKSRSRFRKLVFVSNYQQATYNVGLGVPHAEGVVLQNAIEPILGTEKPQGTIRMIYHTTPHRGLELLVPVCEFLASEGFDFHLDVYSSFAIYGWSQRDEPYKDLFQRITRHPNMTYHGYQPNEVVREALKKAHIYAYPNIWPETSAISVIEAMSAGCLVVCPNYAALPETTANFAAMYPFTEDANAHANRHASVLAEVMSTYWDDGNQNKLRFQKTYVDNFYSWRTRGRQWERFLESLK